MVVEPQAARPTAKPEAMALRALMPVFLYDLIDRRADIDRQIHDRAVDLAGKVPLEQLPFRAGNGRSCKRS